MIVHFSGSEPGLIGLLLADGAVDPFQRASWQAAIVGAMLAIVQFGLGWWKQRRDIRVEQARFGYELLDSLFNDAWAAELLYSLDGSYEKALRSKGNAQLASDFQAYFGAGSNVAEGRTLMLFSRTDAMLYFLDRFEHAVQAGLTTLDDVQTPTAYYARLLAPFKRRLGSYIEDVGYPRVLLLLSRLAPKEWSGLNS